MFGLGLPEILIIIVPSAVVFGGIFAFGYFVGKGRGYRQGIEFMQNNTK